MHDAEHRLDSPERPGRCQAPAVIALFSGQYEEAAEHAQRWVALARAADDDEQIALSLIMLAAVHLYRGELDPGMSTAEEAVEAARRLGAPGLLSNALGVLGGILDQRDHAGDPEQGDPLRAWGPRALAVLDEAAEFATLVGNQQMMNAVLFQTALNRRRRGEHDAALHAALDAAERAHDIGNPLGTALALLVVAFTLSDLSDHEPAVTLIAYVDHRLEPDALHPDGRAERAAALVATTDALGNERVAELERRGAALDEASAIDLGRRAAQSALGSPGRPALP
jgi:tetratricopeptide (TPR) repeat protein